MTQRKHALAWLSAGALLTALSICCIAESINPTDYVAAPPRVTLPGEPVKIDPGPPGGPPSDAIVLFDGKDLSQWLDDKNGPARWDVSNGVATVNHTGYIHTKRPFGDCQLHVEWATPYQIEGEGQGRGNSGVFLQERYEIQVLDSYTNQTYFNGQAGAVYSQYPPLVNCCRPPGEWQVYDIIYHAPRFADDGSVISKGRVTVLQNGVLVQDNVEIQGVTGYPPKYTKHELKEPLQLQDHGNPVRYRNIWIRELK